MIKLPKSVTVNSILRNLVDSVEEQHKSIINDQVSEMIELFEKCLGTMLLYKFERLQYIELLKLNKKISEIYGIEHLLRFIVKFPNLLSKTNYEGESLIKVLLFFNELIKLISNSEYESNYEAASIEYIKFIM